MGDVIFTRVWVFKNFVCFHIWNLTLLGVQRPQSICYLFRDITATTTTAPVEESNRIEWELFHFNPVILCDCPRIANHIKSKKIAAITFSLK